MYLKKKTAKKSLSQLFFLCINKNAFFSEAICQKHTWPCTTQTKMLHIDPYKSETPREKKQQNNSTFRWRRRRCSSSSSSTHNTNSTNQINNAHNNNFYFQFLKSLRRCCNRRAQTNLHRFIRIRNIQCIQRKKNENEIKKTKKKVGFCSQSAQYTLTNMLTTKNDQLFGYSKKNLSIRIHRHELTDTASFIIIFIHSLNYTIQ